MCRGIVGLAEAPFKTQWKFSDKRGALLIMHSVRMTTVPNAFLAYLEKENIDVLKGNDLVISAYSCPAFILYYSNKESETIKIALRMDLPAPDAPGLSAGAHFGGTWWSHGCSGLLRMGFHFEECYTPLYQLKSFVEPRRKHGSPTPDAVENVYWADTKIPWRYLDEDGEEDTVSSDYHLHWLAIANHTQKHDSD
ncbi:hypothetical protein DFH11DRAFT_1623497 [Phellopilus nigrolimitatus]|nr:hypothetical protein DFH11DRAFT_1623497 [Phellopilus nigrolimitatus]